MTTSSINSMRNHDMFKNIYKLLFALHLSSFNNLLKKKILSLFNYFERTKSKLGT